MREALTPAHAHSPAARDSCPLIPECRHGVKVAAATRASRRGLGRLGLQVDVRDAGSEVLADYHRAVSTESTLSLEEQLKELGAQLAWVRDYL